MQKLPVMERFKWHVVDGACTHAGAQDHTCFLVRWGDFCAEGSAQWRRRHLQQTSVVEPQVVCLTLKARRPHEGKTHTHMGQGREARRWLRWEPRLQNETLSISELTFGCLACFLTKIKRLETREIARRTGSFSCGNGVGLCSRHRFQHPHMLVFYHRPSLLRPLLLFPSAPPSPPPLQWRGILCRLLQWSVSSLWAMFLWLEALVKLQALIGKQYNFLWLGRQHVAVWICAL